MAVPINLDEVDNTQLTEDDLPDVLEMVASLRNRADDLGIALKLSPSFCDSRVNLRTVILEWLRENGKEPPTWRGLVKAVKSEVGGRNPALAKSIARQLIEKKASTPVVATPVAEGQMFSQTNSLPTNVSVSRQEVRGNVSPEKILTHPQQATSSLPASITTGTTLSSTGSQGSQQLQFSTTGSLSSQFSVPSNSSLLVPSRGSGDGSPQVVLGRSLSHTGDESSNDPTIAGEDSDHEEQSSMVGVEDIGEQPMVIEPDGDKEAVSRGTESDSVGSLFTSLKQVFTKEKRIKEVTLEEFMSPYKMNPSPTKHGCAVIINIAHVRGLPDRKGATQDQDNLRKLFTFLRYNVTVHPDLKKQGFQELCEKVKAKNFADSDSFVCCFLSHGTKRNGQEVILLADGTALSVDELKQIAVDNESLAGKPKLFFIQACRGEEEKPVRQIQSDGREQTKYLDKTEHLRPYYSDVFVGYPTTTGMKACRDACNYDEGNIKGSAGSWYITELCSVLSSLYKSRDLLSMMTIVHNVLARDARYIQKSKGSDDQYYRQAGQLESTLIRPFFFETNGANTPGSSSSQQTGTPMEH